MQHTMPGPGQHGARLQSQAGRRRESWVAFEGLVQAPQAAVGLRGQIAVNLGLYFIGQAAAQQVRAVVGRDGTH